MRDLINRPQGPHQVTEETVAFNHLPDLLVEYFKSIKRISNEPQFSKLYSIAMLDGKNLIAKIEMLNSAIKRQQHHVNSTKRQARDQRVDHQGNA